MSRPGPPAPPGPHAELDGLPRGARVVLALPSGERLAALLLGCLDRELVAVPLAPRTEPWRIAETAARVRASLVVTADATERTGHDAGHPDVEDLALIMFTSGSTGTPKGVMLPRDAVFGNARRTAALHRFAPDRPHATCLPLYHCNALVMSLVGTHLTGTPLVLHPRFEPEAYFADLAAKEVATASVVPALLPDLLDAAPPWPSTLDYLVTAAAPLTADLARRFHDLYGPRLRQGYGLTELVNFSFTTPELPPHAWEREYRDGHPPVGVALPGTELRLESGEVWIRSAQRMRGYWEDPEATAAALTDDGWLRTGDLGRTRGEMLVLDGRRTERIDRGGEKFSPLEVERSWREAGLTGTVAAVGVPDDVLGHEIGLVAADTSDATLERVRQVAEHGPLRPGAVQLGGFAATPTGKPQRSAMGRSLAAGRVRPRGGPDGPVVPPGAHDRLADRVTELLGGPVTRIDLVAAPGADVVRLLRDAPAGRPVLVVHGGPVADALPAPGTGPGPVTDGPAGARGPDGAGRWDLVALLRDSGRAVVGAAILRAGRHDLGGVVWAR